MYRGADETRACIDSVLAATNTQPTEILVVNDASPEAEICAYLGDLAAAARITLVTNKSNLGFVATCNLAMQMHPERDVVLLNSDTVVAPDWLDRMVACAAATLQTASVTPFSNNATLCSYPRIAVPNELAPGLSLGELDAMFALVNGGRSIQIPTGVGFCMLMKRAAIDAIGMFDADAFGRGYGEENDWCMRASEHGYAHLLCGDVFVYHHGEVSFGGDSLTGKRQAQSVIESRYPGYRELISHHLENDPARVLRRRADLARLRASPRPRVLFVTHSWGGGTEKHVNDLAALLSDSLEILVFKPHDEQSLSLRWLRNGEEFEAFFEDRQDPSALLQLLRAIAVSRVHLHHVHGLPAYVLDIHSELGVPLDITLHDYFPVTQRYHLGPGGVVESNAAAPANDWGLSEVEWQRRMGGLLWSAQRVITPSRDLAQRMREFFPDIKYQVRGHPDIVAKSAPKLHKVLVLGGLSIHKGLLLLEACALDAHARNLPLFFKLIGHTEQSVARFPEIPLVIGGSYRDSDLDQLIALENADAFLFPAQVPESYSYTLSTALRTNLPIIASSLGAFSERLKGNPRARIVSWDANAQVWNDALLAAIAAPRPNSLACIGSADSNRSAQEYIAWYLDAIPAGLSPQLVESTLPTHTVYAPKNQRPRKDYSLKQLFDIGVECGHAPTLNELRRRVGIADVHIVTADHELADASHRILTLHSERDALQSGYDGLRSRFDDLQSRFADLQSRYDNLLMRSDEMQVHLESERDAARSAFDSVVSSTSWRITGPLRSIVAWVRSKRAKLKKATDE